MDFVKNLKAKLGEHNIFSSDDSAVNDDDYVDADLQDYYDEDYDGYDGYDDADVNDYDDYNGSAFTAEDGLGAPEYNSYESTKTASYSAKPKKTAAAPKAAPVSSASSVKSTGNIYNMNTVKQQSNKYKLNSILLRDIYDAKNVASLMIDKDTIVVVNLSLLTEAQKIRAMDFLDGVKYVTKSVFARFTENICTFVPEGVELYGDFFSQIDIESFK